MKEIILKIFRKIELEKRYEKLCLSYDNFEGMKKFKRKEVENYIESYDPEFKYVSRDKLFLKEILYKDYTVRFFIYFRGMIGLGYLIWKEGENHNYYKGNLVSLTELINPQFIQNVKYKTPIATSIDDFKVILDEQFQILEEFTHHFLKETGES